MDFIRLDIQKASSWYSISLPDDTSISIEERTPLWGGESGGAFSLPFTIDIDDNLHFFGNTGEGHGESVVKLLDGAKFRLFVDGTIFKYGIVRLEDEVELSIDEYGHRIIEISLESNRKEFNELLDGVKIRDLNIEQHNIHIGYCAPDELPIYGKYTHEIYGKPYYHTTGKTGQYSDLIRTEEIHYENTISLPKYCVVDYHDGRHGGRFSNNFSNVQHPYNPNNPLEHPYCNVRSCYQKYVYDSGDAENPVWKEERGNDVGETDRVNSAPCFYFGFVYDELFRQMHISVESNALNNILDYRRLAFWHTNCAYKAEPVTGYFFDNSNDSNRVRFAVEYRSGRQYVYYYSHKDNNDWYHKYNLDREVSAVYPLNKCIATTENLPDIEAKDIVEATTSAFGARYIYDSSSNSLRIILVRDVLGNNSITPLNVEVTGNIVKTEKNIKGVKIRYSASGDSNNNSLTKDTNIALSDDDASVLDLAGDTTYNYNDFRNPYVLGMGMAKYNEETGELEYTPGNHPIQDYDTMIQSITSKEMRLFLDPLTGNAYRVKVDGGATVQSEWFPSLFQVAAFRDVNVGDVRDEDKIETISIPFTPAIPNDTNFYKQFKALQDRGGSDTEEERESVETPTSIYAQLVNGEIHHTHDSNLILRRYVYNQIVVAELFDYEKGRTNVSCHVDVNLDVHAVEDYEASNGGDGPYFAEQPSFCLGIMRGSGCDAQTILYEENYDGEGHSHYTKTAGTNAEFTSDIMDSRGNMYDYNGDGAVTKEITADQAKMYIRSYFSKASADLLAPTRKTSKSAMISAGWEYISPNDYTMAYPLHYTMTDIDGVEYHFLMTPISDDGSITTPVGMQGYINDLPIIASNEKVNIMDYCSQNKIDCMIGRYKNASQATMMSNFLNDLYSIIINNQDKGMVRFPDNGLGYDVDDLISLKLKTEIPIDGNPAKGYYPVTNTLAQKRGLVDKFYGTYIYWLLNAKTATIPCIMTARKLKNIDWFTRYDIHGYVGFVSRKSYKISKQGFSDIKLEHKYL